MKKSETILQKDVSELKITVNDILFAVNKLSENFEQRFDNVEQKLTGVEQKLDNVETRLGFVESTINTQMVTKDYLDQKLIKLRGVNKLTNLLQKKRIISPLEAKMVLSI